jgi:small subunit ribosomal protein S5
MTEKEKKEEEIEEKIEETKEEKVEEKVKEKVREKTTKRGGKRDYKKMSEKALEDWVPKTSLGKMVKSGEIKDIEQIYEKSLAILEPEIVDSLIPDLEEEVLKVNMVQRTTDAGRKGSFMITVAVGNKDGYIGVGTGKGLEVRPTIERAVKDAKKKLIHVRRGCGSWECGCDGEHSIPFKVRGGRSSVKVELIPAPKGTGVVAGKTAKKVLELAGIKDVWSNSRGHTRTVFNFAVGTFEALKRLRQKKLSREVGGV